MSRSPGSSASEIWRAKDPWKSQIHTMTGHSNIVIRFRTGPHGATNLREILHFELMRIIGWDVGNWASGVDRSRWDLDLMRSLSGNAFSGFACGPVLCGMVAMYVERDAENDIEEDIADGEDSAATQDLVSSS